MASTVRRLQVLAVTFIAFIGLVLTAPNFVNWASAATVKINLFCVSGGWGYNATYTGNRNSTFNVYYMESTYRGGFGGGDYSWQTMGKLNTGPQGVGSSNTNYGKGQSGTKVTVDIKIGGVTASASRTC